MIRGQGSAGSETLYRHGARPYNSRVELARYLNGSYASHGIDSFSYSVGTWYNVRASSQGVTQSLKVWPASDQEPATWTLQVDNNNISGAGWIGLFRYRTDAVDIDVFGVGTGGDPAPTAPVSGGTSHVSALSPAIASAVMPSALLLAGHQTSVSPAQSSGVLRSLVPVTGISVPVTPAMGSAQAAILNLIAGMVTEAGPVNAVSGGITLGLVTGVSDAFVVALAPTAATAQLQQLQVRIGQAQELQAAVSETLSVPLELRAGNVVQLAPDQSAAIERGLDGMIGFSGAMAPAESISGTLTLTAYTGQVITLDPALAQAEGTQLQLLTGIIIGAFRRSSIVDRSPRYGITDLTPNYSIKDVTYDD
jgi:hypothetical protein